MLRRLTRRGLDRNNERVGCRRTEFSTKSENRRIEVMPACDTGAPAFLQDCLRDSRGAQTIGANIIDERADQLPSRRLWLSSYFSFWNTYRQQYARISICIYYYDLPKFLFVFRNKIVISNGIRKLVAIRNFLIISENF